MTSAACGKESTYTFMGESARVCARGPAGGAAAGRRTVGRAEKAEPYVHFLPTPRQVLVSAVPHRTRPLH